MSDRSQFTHDDRSAVLDVLNGVAYILDSRAYDRLGEVFAADIHFDNPGRLTADGLDKLIDAFKAIANPSISHHITNVVVVPDTGERATATSKALTIRADKAVAAAEYTDVVKKTAAGWRIASRSIRPLS